MKHGSKEPKRRRRNGQIYRTDGNKHIQILIDCPTHIESFGLLGCRTDET